MRGDGARLKLEFQASSLHAFILVGIRDLDNATPPQDLATATAQKFPQGLLQPDQGIKQYRIKVLRYYETLELMEVTWVRLTKKTNKWL